MLNTNYLAGLPLLVLAIACSDHKEKDQDMKPHEAKASTVIPGESTPARDKQAIEPKSVNADEVYLVPNQFPLKDGKLEKKTKQEASEPESHPIDKPNTKLRNPVDDQQEDEKI